MSAPHSPVVRYLCDDPDCCYNGCPEVTCRTCGKRWPCPNYQATHTQTQVLAQVRYRARKHYPDDPEMVDYVVGKFTPAPDKENP